MMKFKKQLALLVLLIAAALAAAIAAYSLPDEEADESANESMLTNINAGEVQAVVLNNSYGSRAFINTPSGIVTDDDSDIYAQDKLINLVYTLTHITSERDVELKNEDGCGFDNPAASVSILLEDETIHLTLGRRSPLAELYYLKINESGKTGLISEDTAKLMLQSFDDLRELSLFPDINSGNLSKLSEIKISTATESMTLMQLKTDTSSTFFGLIEPVTAVLNWENVYRKVISPLYTLMPEHFVSDNRPLSDFGLDEPEYVLELVIDGKKYRCGFSAKDPDTYYCANLDNSLVSEIGREQLVFLSYSYIDLIADSVYNKSAADVSRLSARYDGGSTSIEISGEGDMLSADAQGVQLDNTATVELFRIIGNIPPAGRLKGDEETGQSVLTLFFTLRDGSEDILEFMPVSDRQCAVYINGSAEFTTYLTSVRDIINALKALK